MSSSKDHEPAQNLSRLSARSNIASLHHFARTRSMQGKAHPTGSARAPSHPLPRQRRYPLHIRGRPKHFAVQGTTSLESSPPHQFLRASHLRLRISGNSAVIVAMHDATRLCDATLILLASDTGRNDLCSFPSQCSWMSEPTSLVG